MKGKASWVLAGIVLAFLLVGAGWWAKSVVIGKRDAESALARVRDSVRTDSLLRVQHEKYAADSSQLALQAQTQEAQARALLRQADRLRDSAGRATGRADSALAVAKDAADSVKVIPELRLANLHLSQANDSLRLGAAFALDSLKAVHVRERESDRTLAESNAAVLRQNNAKLAADLAALHRQKWFHVELKPKFWAGVVVGGLATYAGCRLLHC